MYLIVGLGNPGKEYEKTRHNVGFMVVDYLARALGIAALKEKHKLKALMAEIKVGGHKVIFAEPLTYMNRSGEAVSEIVQWYKIPKDHIILVSDDVDLKLGQLRIRKKGAAGGHKGLESVIQHLKTADFTRLRIGVGRGQAETADYVLGNFPKPELLLIDDAIVRAADAIIHIVYNGADSAMNKFNG